MDHQEKNSSLDELIKSYTSLKYNEQKTKVICEWSGHEMPAKVEAVLVYVNGNKYKSLIQAKINNEELKKYSEFLITKPKQRNKNQLFCLLTLKYVNKRPDHLQLHVTGHKFQKAYKHWLYCKENNIKFLPFSKQAKMKELERMEEDEDFVMSNDDESNSSRKEDDVIESEYDKDTGNESGDDVKSVDSMSDLYPDVPNEVDKNAEAMANFKFISKKNPQKNLEDDFQMNCDINDDLNGMEKINNKRKLNSKLNKKHKIEPTRKKFNV